MEYNLRHEEKLLRQSAPQNLMQQIYISVH